MEVEIDNLKIFDADSNQVYPNAGDVEETTTGDVEETTTGDVEETTTGDVEETTTDSQQDEGWADSGVDWQYHGDWKVYAGAWSNSQADYKLFEESNAIGVRRRHDAPGDIGGETWDQWACQIQFEVLEGLDPSESYTFTADLSSDTTDGKVYLGGTAYEFGNNPQQVSLTAEPSVMEGTDIVYLQITMALGHVGMGNGVYLKNAKLVDSQGNVIYPASSTPVETSTEKKTEKPTEKPTVKPTEKQTEKATTSAFKKTQQVKVKKAIKKKNAKKLKVTLTKKVAGANGYQVRVFKTKSAAQKNKKSKAIIKYTIKKNTKTITIKNNKLKKQKKLYVRVRAYAKVKGKRVYSKKWSKVKKVKIK